MKRDLVNELAMMRRQVDALEADVTARCRAWREHIDRILPADAGQQQRQQRRYRRKDWEALLRLKGAL